MKGSGLFWLLWLGGALAEEGPQPHPERHQAPPLPLLLPQAATRAAEKQPNLLDSQLVAMLPLDRPSRGVVIPRYEDNEVRSVLKAATVTRVSPHELTISGLEVEFYDEGLVAEPSSRVLVEAATFDLRSNLLRSESPTMIVSGDMITHGVGVLFNQATGEVRLLNDVRSTLFIQSAP
ncbi:MAG: hypothetical protein AAF555_07755 [Verrucomicrobiota bacterium]